MKRGDFTGIKGIPTQDMAMWESMGPIADRSRDQLGSSDVAVVQFRRMMVAAAKKFRGRRPGHRHRPSRASRTSSSPRSRASCRRAPTGARSACTTSPRSRRPVGKMVTVTISHLLENVRMSDALRDLAIANRILAHEGVVDAFGHVSIRHPGAPGPVLHVALARAGAGHRRGPHGVRARRHAGRPARPHALLRALHPRRDLREARRTSPR